MTKRAKRDTDKIIVRRTWPLLRWVECVYCAGMVRREWVWVALGGPYVGGRGRLYHGCRDCFPDRERFAGWVARGVYEPRRPSVPAPHPPSSSPRDE